MTKHTSKLIALLPLLSLGACVIAPEQDAVALGNPYASVHFSGYASAPGATIEVNVLNKATNQWETVITTSSSDNPLEFGGEELYDWSVSTALIEQGNADHLCRLTPGCTLNESSVVVQFEEIDGAFTPLMTFDQGGVQCTYLAVNAGADLLTAAWGCKGAAFDRLSIPVIL